jgi:hypothetical protein
MWSCSALRLNQGGTNHINEQQHSYWAKLFAARDFYPLDLFRPENENVDIWYRQNVFLYVRKDSSEWQVMAKSGHRNMANIDELYSSRHADFWKPSRRADF